VGEIKFKLNFYKRIPKVYSSFSSTCSSKAYSSKIPKITRTSKLNSFLNLRLEITLIWIKMYSKYKVVVTIVNPMEFKIPI